jgi:hypothetical protein
VQDPGIAQIADFIKLQNIWLITSAGSFKSKTKNNKVLLLNFPFCFNPEFS